MGRSGALATSWWNDVDVSNRRRTTADRARARAVKHPSTSRSRPFGGRPRGGRRSLAVLRRLHAMPRWAVPLATVVMAFVGLYAGPVVGGLCLLAIAGFLGWLAFLAWPQLGAGGRAMRGFAVALVTLVGLARLTGLWAS